METVTINGLIARLRRDVEGCQKNKEEFEGNWRSEFLRGCNEGVELEANTILNVLVALKESLQ